MIKKYFVYIHRRADCGDVFYVGKGTWTPLKKYIRASTTSRRNIHWKRIVAKCGGFTHEVVADFDVEADAFAEEIRLIAVHGKCNDGGLLCNITDGGEGHSGLSPTIETRAKMSAAHSGKLKSESVKQAVSKAQRGIPNPSWQNEEHSRKMTGSGHPKFGKKDSAETCAKRSASMTGKLAGEKHPFFGKKRPQHVIDVLRAKQSKRVFDSATGAIYATLADAAMACGRSSTTVSRWLSGHRPNPTTLRFA